MEQPSASRPTVTGPVFVCAVRRANQVGPVAPWITMASWARAAELEHGAASVATTEGFLCPDEALARAASGTRRSESASGWRRRVPAVASTLVKDARRVPANRRFAERLGAASYVAVPYVFQLHGLLWDAGLRLAAHLGVPSVLVVDACQVQEARSWGVGRPGWSWLAERRGERPQLLRADLVVCVSDEVAHSVRRLTGRRDGIIVVPNGVDVDRFHPGLPHPKLLADLGFAGQFVVGWAGSFRSFHGLETLLEAVGLLQGRVGPVTLLLIGDGLGRPTVEARASALGLNAVFTGTVPYPSMPDYLRLADVGVVLADSGSFHYSPVKLREFQACGVAVVASAAGEMSRDLHDGVDALLTEPGDVESLARALQRLHDRADLRAALVTAGRAAVERNGSWSSRLSTVQAALVTEIPADSGDRGRRP